MWPRCGARSRRPAGGAADLCRSVGRARRVVRPGPDPRRRQRGAVRAATRHLCDPASFLGRRAGRNDAQALLGVDRAHRLDAQIERRGLWAVVGQRFVPGISDALASYTFGAFGVPLWQMVVGSFIGSAPRVFVYTALGASITNLSSPLVYSAIAVWCVTAIIGAFAARRWYRKWRARPRRRCGLAQLTTGSQQRHTSHRTPAGVVMPGSLSEHRRLRQEAPDRIEHHPPIE